MRQEGRISLQGIRGKNPTGFFKPKQKTQKAIWDNGLYNHCSGSNTALLAMNAMESTAWLEKKSHTTVSFSFNVLRI